MQISLISILFLIDLVKIDFVSYVDSVSIKKRESTYLILANQQEDKVYNSTLIPQHNNFSQSSNTNQSISECIGNRIEALESGRQCSKKCKLNSPCENVRKQCLCDGLCGLSCIKPDMTCQDLPELKNGKFDSKSVYIFNTQVTFECDLNYYLFGSKTRTCQGDEEWSGTPVECLPEPACKNPEKIQHAKNPNQVHYRLNDKVFYSCYQGYEPHGSSKATCIMLNENQTGWKWVGQPFKCIPKSCGEPASVLNAQRIGDSFIIASSVSYTCNEGFEMIGQSRRYCQSDGQWSGQAPQCEPVTCSPTDHLDNGRINYVYPLVYNSTVEYSCDYGFKLVGAKVRVCGAEKKLLGQLARCEEIDCGLLGELKNGYIKGYSSRMGDKKEFICKESMTFVGDSRESYCLSNATWSHPVPKCMAPCLIPRIQNSVGIYLLDDGKQLGKMSIEKLVDNPNITIPLIKSGTLVKHGAVFDVACAADYDLDTTAYDSLKDIRDSIASEEESILSNSPKCYDGKWNFEPKCIPARCNSLPPQPPNGRTTMLSTVHGSKAYIRCLDGYKLEGDNVSECVKGNWTQINTKCTELYCRYPGAIANGKVMLVGQTGMYDFKPYITRTAQNRQIAYECETGYHIKEGAQIAATCLNGKWTPEGLPTCSKDI